jgi:type II secretory pathway pseudopilin PulG
MTNIVAAQTARTSAAGVRNRCTPLSQSRTKDLTEAAPLDTVSRYRPLVEVALQAARGAKWARRGFSAVELMNFLALAAVLSAIGMYALARYVRHAKTVEAVNTLTSLATLSAEYYNTSDATQPAGAAPQAVHAMRHFPPSSRVPVPEDALMVRRTRFQSNLSDWAASPWRDLRFSIVQPQCYQYSFDAQGAGASARALITAQGDLDGDGVRSAYSISVAPNDALTAQVAPNVTRTNAEE